MRRRDRSKPGVVLVKLMNCLRGGCCFSCCLGCGCFDFEADFNCAILTDLCSTNMLEKEDFALYTLFTVYPTRQVLAICQLLIGIIRCVSPAWHRYPRADHVTRYVQFNSRHSLTIARNNRLYSVHNHRPLPPEMSCPNRYPPTFSHSTFWRVMGSCLRRFLNASSAICTNARLRFSW